MSLFGGPSFAATSNPRPPDDHASPPLEKTSDSADWSDGSLYSPVISDVSQDGFSDDSPGSPSSAAEASHSTKNRAKFLRETRSDRDVFKHLQQQDHNDLSAHLFNAHVLKSRTYDAGYVRQKDSQAQVTSKRAWRQKDVWAPPRTWTAWPLRLEDVPLDEEEWGREPQWTQAEDSRTHKDHSERPSHELRDVLVAECLRETSLAHSMSTGISNMPGQLSRSPSSAGSGSSDEAMSGGSAASEGSSSAEDSDSVGDRRARHGCTDEYEPTPIIDGTQTTRVLQPMISNTLRDLDNLLYALHRTRENHVMEARPKKRKREREEWSAAERGQHSGAQEKESRFQKAQSRKADMRDWSEILGTAAQMDWDRGAIERTRHRCEKIFGESMSFQTFNEGPVDVLASTRTDKNVAPIEDEVIEAAENAHIPSQDLENSTLAHQCPETSCAKLFRSQEEWLQHIDDDHGYEYTGVETIVQLNREKEESLCCPDPDCQRHDWPFPHRWRLNQHMKRSHGKRLERRSSTPASSRRSATPEVSDGQEEMNGGAHVDGFLKPIPAPKGGSKSRSMSTSRVASRRTKE